MRRPLEGVRVLTLEHFGAGPYATLLMAELGAEVIKIESLEMGGDASRPTGPYLLGDHDSQYFQTFSRHKKSVALELKTPQGRADFERLVASAEVVVGNLRGDQPVKLGITFEALKRVNPAIVCGHLSAYGRGNSRESWPGYDYPMQAECGLMSLTGERDGAPQKVGVPIVDLMTGMYAAIAILAAHANRERTGAGETIDLAMLDVQAAFLGNQAMNWLIGNKLPHRAGNRHPNIQPQDVFPAADGHIVLAVGNDGQFVKLCEAIGRAAWASDPRFIRNADRVRNEAELTPLLAQRFRDFTRAELTALLDAAGVPCGPINTVPDVFADPQILHRGMLRQLPHPLAGTVPQVVSPIRMQDAPLAFDRAPPTLGQHTAELLAELGLGDAEREALATKGVI